MQDNNQYNEELFLKVADLSKDEGYISFPVYQSNQYSREVDEVVIPLTAYYFEALRLCIFSGNDLEYYDNLVETINKLWFACDRTNFKMINEFLVEKTNILRILVRNSEKNPRGIFLNFSNGFLLGNYPEIIKYYDKWIENKDNRDISESFSKKTGICVALAMPKCYKLMNDSNCYFSLSGSRKDYKGSIGTFKSRYNLDSIYDSINSLLESIFGFRFIDCHLEDNTRRYTYFSTNEEARSHMTYNGNVLKFPVKFLSDYKRYFSINPSKLNLHYSCCEKKIISKMGLLNTGYQILKTNKDVVNILTSYEFRIKYKPCRMCCPALIGCYHIEYMFTIFSSFLTTPSSCNRILLNPLPIKKEPLIVA